MFLNGHPKYQLVFMRIWQIEPNYLTKAFREYYADNALNKLCPTFSPHR